MEGLRAMNPPRRAGSMLLRLLVALAAAAAAAAAQETFTCADESGRTIPAAWVDDGYCDCPGPNGTDEPNTSACSLAKRDQT